MESETTTLPAPVDSESDDITITHIYCCVDVNSLLCREEATGEIVAQRDDQTNCAECEYAARVSTCPVLHICPYDYNC